MKKKIRITAAIVMALFTLAVPAPLIAGEGGMHGMKAHDMKGMMGKTPGQTVTDPVCGMQIDPATAAGGKVDYEGKTYYFCGDSDREAFKKDPAKYIKQNQKEDHHEMEMKDEEKHGDHHDMEMKDEEEHGDHHGMGMHEEKEQGEHHHMEGGHHWMAPAEAAAKVNPVEPTEASVTKGKSIFEQRCIICHGADAKGTGALAASLNPKPSDLTSEHTRMHPDGGLFFKISKGRGAMPAWETTISEEDRWNLINYIRSLSK